ncbi:hypothetical protein COOONC_17904 [Cooperia oncophora]
MPANVEEIWQRRRGYVQYVRWMRAVVDHSVIDSIIEDIMKKFSRNAKALLHAEYNCEVSLVSQRDDISREEEQFFLLWSGTPVSFSSVSPLLRPFFINSQL